MTDEREYIDFDCIVAKQPIGDMYIGVINHDDLQRISYTDVRRIEFGNDKRDIESYIGIQRELSPKREKDIGQYVNLVDASFPNSIILAIKPEDAIYDSVTKKMKIKNKSDVAKVLDGQHRIAGLKHFVKEEGRENFECVVTIYIEMEMEDQAIVFATINTQQTKVTKSLAQELFAFAESRSPQKTAHNIVRALYKKEGSPFYRKIKILGKAVSEEETITQDTFAKSIINYISNNPQLDRDFYKRNVEKKNAKLPLVSGAELKKLFLRNIFIEDESDVKIAQLIWNYFYAVQQKWPNAWDKTDLPKNILNKSTGFVALMRFFKDAYLSFGRIGDLITKEEFVKLFEPITLKEEDFTTETYKPGSSGQSELYKALLTQSGLDKTTQS